MLTVLILTSVIALAYLGIFVKVSGGIPESLSATYYGLKEDGWLFQALCIGMAFGLLPMWIESCCVEYEYLPFLACGSLGFVGIAPSFKLKLEGMIHYSAAVVCCVSAILWLLLSGNYPIVIWWSGICQMLYLQFGRWCWWLEVGVMGAVFTALALTNTC